MFACDCSVKKCLKFWEFAKPNFHTGGTLVCSLDNVWRDLKAVRLGPLRFKLLWHLKWWESTEVALEL